MKVNTPRLYDLGVWILLAALVADILGWLGPRNCPVCRQRRSLAERFHGCHICDIDADRHYGSTT